MRFIKLLLFLTACAGLVHSEKVRDRDNNTWTCRTDDNVYQSATNNYKLHRYSVRKGCSAGEMNGKAHDAICMSSGGEQIAWIGDKDDVIFPKFKRSTQKCKGKGPHPFKYDPGSSKGFLVSPEVDPDYEECAFEVSLDCPSGQQGDPHIIIKGTRAEQLEDQIQNKLDDLKKLFKNLEEKLNDK
jgi:hypothetical protein